MLLACKLRHTAKVLFLVPFKHLGFRGVRWVITLILCCHPTRRPSLSALFRC
jgi:hypothetical protein